jgi:hypothetical protein
MHKQLILIFGLLLSATLIGLPIEVVQSQTRFPGDVQLVVNAGDLQDTITKSLRQELRKIPGVFVTIGESDWILHVVAMKLTTKSGAASGLAVSWAIMKPHLGEPPGLVQWRDQGLRAGTMSDLNRICTGIVKDFQTQHLEPERKKSDKE